MRALVTLCLVILGFSVQGAELTPDDFRPRAYEPQNLMPTSERLKMLDLLEKLATGYSAEIETVTWKSFENIRAEPSVISSLTTSAEDVKALMRVFVSQIRGLKETPDDRRSWLLLVRNFTVMGDTLVDLDRYRIVKSQDYVGIRILMRPVFDKILLPDEQTV
jgi:hypothetical protein